MPGACATGTPSASKSRSSTHAVPAPERKNPKYSRCPCKFTSSRAHSGGMTWVIVEKEFALDAVRSMRHEYLPLWTA